MVQETAVSHVYCDACWLIARGEAGPCMLEGPATWGESWHEVEEWLARSLLAATTLAYRRLIAHELRRQMPHLSGVVPPSIAAFLLDTDERAG
jgi:hypothetical protein